MLSLGLGGSDDRLVWDGDLVQTPQLVSTGTQLKSRADRINIFDDPNMSVQGAKSDL